MKIHELRKKVYEAKNAGTPMKEVVVSSEEAFDLFCDREKVPAGMPIRDIEHTYKGSLASFRQKLKHGELTFAGLPLVLK